MHTAVHAFRYVNIVGYVALALVAAGSWRRRRDRAGMWAALAFGSIGLIELLALIPNHRRTLATEALTRTEVALLVLFPYLLFRFTTAFRTASRRTADVLFALTSILLVWTFAMHFPRSGEARSAVFLAYLGLFLLHWTVLSVLTAARLVLAGRAQPNVARRRMQMLAFAAASITVALFLSAATTNVLSALELGAQILAAVAVAAFFLGLSPPPLVRLWWRTPEQARLQNAIAGLLAFASTQEEVAGRVLGPASALVGARAIAIRNEEGRIVGAWNVPDEAWRDLERGAPATRMWPDAEVVDLDVPGGSLVVWTSPYAPFFGDEELRLLRTLGALTGLALDRVRLFKAEHDARVELERANEVKANFVALAAHELRTPMTTIHGFVTTLHHLGDRLDDGQREQLREALISQTHRMALLIEQLLDLSRLDAEAIEISPEPLRMREHVLEIVEANAPAPSSVEVEVPEDVVAVVDRNALDRIVSNLVTNAFRYGSPPVRVRAVQTDRHFRLAVEDCGSGVPPEFVPDLFERFARSESARSTVGGTGLGLAIARSYARAHGGDLIYEPAQPHGARFQLVLPSSRAAQAAPAGTTAVE